MAITEYVYEDREPSMDGPAMSVFTMGRYQLDQKLGQRRANRKNASRRRESKAEENAANDERTVSESEANDERTSSETVANQKRTDSDGQAKADNSEQAKVPILQTTSSNLQDSNDLHLPLPPLAPVRVKTGDAPPFGEVPTTGQWFERCRDYCERHGVEPDEDEFARSYGYYEDHGWCHEDGTRYGNWHRLVATCMRRLKSDQEEACRSGRPVGARRGHRGRASPAHRPSLAAQKASERTVHIDDFDKFLGEES